jgi:F0F1-type ATP synthase epsilon subunit
MANLSSTQPSTDKTDVLSSTPLKEQLHVKIYSPFQTYFDRDALSISAVNTTGPFDILPRHHNFITLLNPCELVIDTVNGKQRIRIARGIMHVKANQVIVFLDI